MADPTLDDRILATLQQPCTAQAAASVLADAQKALADANAKAGAADAASFNPLLAAAEAQAQRAQAGDLRFAADRLDAQVAALEVRVSKLAEAEAAEERGAHRAAVLAERDALAADIAEQYPRIVGTLASLAQRILASDADLAEIGIDTNAESAEAKGRGIASVVYFGNGLSAPGTHGPVRRIQNLFLQMPASHHGAWSDLGGWSWRALDEGLPASLDAEPTPNALEQRRGLVASLMKARG